MDAAARRSGFVVFQCWRRSLAAIVTGALLATTLPVNSGRAAMIATDAVGVAGTPSTATLRARLDAFLQRADVQAGLTRLGVPPEEAQARVAALSDTEVDLLAGRVADVPAGGDTAGLAGLVLLTVVAMLVSDVLCYTNIFQFNRCVLR